MVVRYHTADFEWKTSHNVITQNMSFFITFRAIAPILYSLKHHSIKGFVFRRYKIGAFFRNVLSMTVTNNLKRGIRTSHWRYSVKKVYLKISQGSQENTCAGVFFNIVAGPEGYNFIKKRLQHKCFPVRFATFLTKPFWRTYGERLLLDYVAFLQWILRAFNPFRANDSWCFDAVEGACE